MEQEGIVEESDKFSQEGRGATGGLKGGPSIENYVPAQHDEDYVNKQHQIGKALAIVPEDLMKQNKELMLINDLTNATYQVPFQVVNQMEKNFPSMKSEYQQMEEVEMHDVERALIPVIARKTVPMEPIHALVSH